LVILWQRKNPGGSYDDFRSWRAELEGELRRRGGA
jgi:hypothetical protein